VALHRWRVRQGPARPRCPPSPTAAAIVPSRGRVFGQRDAGTAPREVGEPAAARRSERRREASGLSCWAEEVVGFRVGLVVGLGPIMSSAERIHSVWRESPADQTRENPNYIAPRHVRPRLSLSAAPWHAASPLHVEKTHHGFTFRASTAIGGAILSRYVAITRVHTTANPVSCCYVAGQTSIVRSQLILRAYPMRLRHDEPGDHRARPVHLGRCGGLVPRAAVPAGNDQ
jgi:hypothetical protein